MSIRGGSSCAGVAAAVFVIGFSPSAWAKLITITPADGTTAYTKIEAAGAGDEVVIAPGTYKFRVYLSNSGTAGAPIVIRAQDPLNRPVWDLAGTYVQDAPGSYTAGDRGRGCWQVAGDYYQISGLVFANCRSATPGAAAGMRYYNDAKGLVVKDCLFKSSDNGLTGGSVASEATVEFCEFDHNGNTAANPPTHNIYVYGGKLALRYSYSHDATQGLDLHCRAHDAIIEYNWFSRGTGTEIQFDSPDFPPPGHYTRNIAFRGNVIVQAAAPANNFKVVTLYNDEGNDEQISFVASYNTLVGNGGHAAFVQLANADHTLIAATLNNNVFAGTTVTSVIDDTTKGTVTGTHNWIQTGAAATGLTASIAGAAPGFRGNGDYHLAAGSACIGAALPTAAPGVPDREYAENEAMPMNYRARATASDVGAFEHDNASATIGPYGTPLPPRNDPDAGASAGSSGVGGTPGTINDGTSSGSNGSPGNGAVPSEDSGCTLASESDTRASLAALAGASVAALALVGRRKRRS